MSMRVAATSGERIKQNKTIHRALQVVGVRSEQWAVGFNIACDSYKPQNLQYTALRMKCEKPAHIICDDVRGYIMYTVYNNAYIHFDKHSIHADAGKCADIHY